MKNMKIYTILFISFMLIVILLFIYSVLLKNISKKNKITYEEFEKNIELVLEKVNDIYMQNAEYIGINLNNYSEKDKYEEEIKQINKKYNRNLIEKGYFLLNVTHKKQLGLENIPNDYIVNYITNEVYSLKPIYYNGEKIYTTKIISDNIGKQKELGYNAPIIPSNFRYVTGRWDTGFVITDQSGNEFVWVPVGYLNNEKPADALKRYYREYNTEIPKTEEYIAIENSINKYGGFYIARYEASLKGANSVTSKGNTNVLQIKKDVIPISNMSYSTDEFSFEYSNVNNGLIKVNIPLSNDKVFYGYDNEGNLLSSKLRDIYNEETMEVTKEKPKIKGALEMAKSMSNDYEWDSSIHTTLLHTEHLDTLLKIIEQKGLLKEKNVNAIDENGKNIIKNAIKEDNLLWGNFMNSEFRYNVNGTIVTKNRNEGSLIPTGVTTYEINSENEKNNNKIFNIYDLAGNLNEWTTEIVLDNYVVSRGGSFDKMSSATVCEYISNQKNERNSNTGIRIIMYID